MAVVHAFVAPDLERLGALGQKPRNGEIARVHFTAPGSEDAVRAFLREQRLPPASTDRAVVPVVADALPMLRDDRDALAFLRDCTGPDGFRRFLTEWVFLSEGGAPSTLGASLWPSQEIFLDAIREHPWVYFLKARQLGETTIACAYDGWHVRFGVPNARAHLFSRREDEAQELLEQVEYGLRNLPDWLQLPTSRRTSRILIFDAGPGDARTLKPYPADRSTSRGATCTHAHLDEWAVMGDPRRVMASVEPSIAPGGSCHILTTEVGPESPTAAYWRRCIESEGKHAPVFISALERPDRTAEWYEGQRRAMPLADFNREYPQTWQQALEAGGERMFRSADIDLAAEYARGFSAYVKGRKYACGVDIGLMQDATVLTVLDVTEGVVDVVHFRHLVKASVGEVQWAIEEVHRLYPTAQILVEDNAIGYAIRQNANVPEHRMSGFVTTGLSKPRILGNLQYAIEQQTLKWKPDECPQLDREMRGYAIPDHNIKQDCVISLALALEAAPKALNPDAGRILGVIYV